MDLVYSERNWKSYYKFKGNLSLLRQNLTIQIYPKPDLAQNLSKH